MKKLKMVQRARIEAPRPRDGWIRSIRESLGMSAAQLGRRLGVCRQRIAQVEKDELPGNVTLKSMTQLADAMDCVFVYWVVPKTSLEEIVRSQAKKIAEASVDRTAQAMSLEGQAITEQDRAELIEGAIDALLNDDKARLWENQ